MIKLQCSKCEYEKHYTENTLLSEEKCEWCGAKMILAKEEIGKIVEHDSILQMKKQIEDLGHSKVWAFIEKRANPKMRLSYRRLFFKAGGIFPNPNV